MDLDRRRLVDAKLSVVVEVTLFDPSFAEGNAVEQGGRQSEKDAALDLRSNDVGIDLDTAVDAATIFSSEISPAGATATSTTRAA